MAKKSQMEWKCAECDHIMQDYLKAPNPFNPKEDIYGCQRCFSVNSLLAICDEEGCDKEPSCGTPTPDGYRRTCSEHQP
jgi:hypothetical protein